MKRTPARISAVLALALLMTGCAAGGGSSDGADSAGTECIAPGAASDAVTVEGDAGALELTSETPVTVDAIERTVIEEGEGDVVEEGGALSIAMTYFNGGNGEVVQQFPASEVVNSEEQLRGWAYEAVRCAQEGQRVALVVPQSEVLDTTAEEAGITGMSDEDPFIIVADFTAAPMTCDISAFEGTDLLAKAEGTPQEAPAGFPSVELDADGAPTITMPSGAGPAELSIATLIEGDGEVVEPGDCVAVNYRGVIWDTGEEFDSSWKRGEPTAFSTEGVIGGFKQALEGQKVGSQVISVVPAEDGGYGADWLVQQGYDADDVMVFVLDIVGVKKPGAEE